MSVRLLAAVSSALLVTGSFAAFVVGRSVGPDPEPRTVADFDDAFGERPSLDGSRVVAAAEPDDDPDTVVAAEADEPVVASLWQTSDCGELHRVLVERWLDEVGPYGHGRWSPNGFGVPGSMAAGGSTGMSGSSAGAPAPSPAASDGANTVGGTNVQEAGIDEPDMFKVDDGVGILSRMSRADDGYVTDVIDLSGDAPVVTATLSVHTLGPARHLLVDGYAVTFGTRPDGGDVWAVHDVHDPTDPVLIGASASSGRIVDVRRIGTTVHVVRHDDPDLGFVRPATDGQEDHARALEVNRGVVRDSALADLARPDVSCDRVHLAPEGTRIGQTVIESFTVDDPDAVERSVVMAQAAEVYLSAESLVFSTYTDWAESPATSVHRFDVDGPDLRYQGSARVPGVVGDVWRLSEHAGHLRVVSDNGPQGIQLTVLRPTGDVLVPVGVLTGFPPGHEAYAVRFFGGVGFVVTYQRVDPLHVIDLSDPSNPRFRGILETPGFATYLHPVADGILLGLGYDDERSSQLVTYDITDLDKPTRPTVVRRENWWSRAFDDHHAVTWSGSHHRLVLADSNDDRGQVGATVFDVQGHDITEVGNIRHPLPDRCMSEERPGEPEQPDETGGPVPILDEQDPDDDPSGDDGARPDEPSGDPCAHEWDLRQDHQVLRTVVVGDDVVSVSSAGIAVDSLASLARRHWVRFEPEG